MNFGGLGRSLFSRGGGVAAPQGGGAAVELQPPAEQPPQETNEQEQPERDDVERGPASRDDAAPQRDIENNAAPAAGAATAAAAADKSGANKDAFFGSPDDKGYNGPMARFEPIRTDPIKALKDRQKRLDNRITAKGMPEIHFIGQLTSGQGLIMDATEGAFCRWKIYAGKAWEHLSGETFGQSQVAYCRSRDTETLSFNHPVDVHFAVAGLQGLGAPRIAVQCYRMDWHGRRLLCGYGFAHLPTVPGIHRVEICLWRPVGTPGQELEAFLLGRTPALASHEPIYDSAWRERCRLVTVAAGKVYAEFFVTTRFFKEHGVDFK